MAADTDGPSDPGRILTNTSPSIEVSTDSTTPLPTFPSAHSRTDSLAMSSDLGKVTTTAGLSTDST